MMSQGAAAARGDEAPGSGFEALLSGGEDGEKKKEKEKETKKDDGAGG